MIIMSGRQSHLPGGQIKRLEKEVVATPRRLKVLPGGDTGQRGQVSKNSVNEKRRRADGGGPCAAARSTRP